MRQLRTSRTSAGRSSRRGSGMTSFAAILSVVSTLSVSILTMMVIQGEARNWENLELIHETMPSDPEMIAFIESGAFEFTVASTEPSAAPFSGSRYPTLSPQPTQTPSSNPTVSTELPTKEPTSSPTIYPYSENPQPLDFPPTYFDYNRGASARRGPNNWHKVSFQGDQNPWYEFSPNGWGPYKGLLAGYNVGRNYCGTDGQQSPINVYDTGRRCGPDHQIRPRPGDFKIEERGNITKMILPNKLRLQYARRPCVGCAEPDPPHADFPDGFGGGSDLLHVDIKIPSEHRINGKQYPGEYQMFHIHAGRKRSPVISVMIDYNDTTPTNTHMQKALDQFWKVYNDDAKRCARKEQGDHIMINVTNSDHTRERASTTTKDKAIVTNDENQLRRRLQQQEGESVATEGAWDPYKWGSIFNTFHFYGYEGSTTEPPCGTFAHWFILDQPMMLSMDQFKQIKDLIFTHVDDDCTRTSVHYDESVARPIQPLKKRGVFRCTRDNFVSDAEEDARTFSLFH